MSELKIKGRIKVVFEKQTFDSGFEKKEFVITTDGEYPQEIKFELIKDKCKILSENDVDKNVEVYFNLNGKEWNGKYFVNLQCWKLEKEESVGTPNDNLPF